jgi:excisionase family DNA binding protein
MPSFKDDLLASCSSVQCYAEPDASDAVEYRSASASPTVSSVTREEREFPARPDRTPHPSRAPPAVVPLQPIGVPPLLAAVLIGGSRSTVYRLLNAGKLRAIKRGTATLVLTESIYAYLASLPAATFGGVARRGHTPQQTADAA